MKQINQNSAANVMVFMTDSTDHITGKIGLTLVITASKDGGAFGAIAPTVTDRGSGWYNLALTAGMTDTLGDLALHITAAGADPSDVVGSIVAASAGGTDWSASEREQIRQALGITGTKLATSGGNIDTIVTKLPTNNMMGAGDKDNHDTDIDTIKAKTDNLPADPASNTQVNTRLATAGYTAPDNAGVTAIKLKTDNLPADPASNTQVNTRLATSGYTAPDNAGVTAIKAKTDNLPIDPADESLLEAAIATRMAGAAYTAPDNAGIAAIKAKTDNLPSGIRKNAALNNFSFAMIDATTHYSFKTGLTITAQRSIDGGAFASCTNAVTEVGNGVYKINLSAADTNGNVILLKFTAAGADDRMLTIITEA